MSDEKQALLRLRFRNRIEAVPELRRRVKEYLAERGCAEKAADEFVLAIDELANNAIQHGPAGNAPLRLDVRVESGRRETYCCLTAPSDMSDEEMREITEGASLPDFESERGRGLFLIRMMVDEFHVQSKGDGLIELEMRKSW